MPLPTKWSCLLSGVICGMVLAAGCASKTKQQWLTLFFDGVPGSTNSVAAPKTAAPARDITELPPIWRMPPPLGPSAGGSPMVVHQPYAERRCTECHASNFSERLKGDVSSLCIACHKAFLVRAKYTHAPVVDGQCTLCHQPHQASEKFLLVRNEQELCFGCHELESFAKNRGCGAPQGRRCTNCHDPHQENTKFLLFPPDKTSPVRKMAPEK
jgi:predicted CXXCH cytochrome family protein